MVQQNTTQACPNYWAGQDCDLKYINNNVYQILVHKLDLEKNYFNQLDALLLLVNIIGRFAVSASFCIVAIRP